MTGETASKDALHGNSAQGVWLDQPSALGVNAPLAPSANGSRGHESI